MTRQQLIGAYSAPDSVYWKKSNDDSVMVMTFTLKDDNQGQVLVELRQDTVRDIKYQLLEITNWKLRKR